MRCAFLLKILFAPILAVLAVVTWFFVFVVSLSSGILCIPAAILGFFGLFIHLRGFRQLRRGAAGDRVPHQPLRTCPCWRTWLVAKLHVLRYMLRDWIYG